MEVQVGMLGDILGIQLLLGMILVKRNKGSLS